MFYLEITESNDNKISIKKNNLRKTEVFSLLIQGFGYCWVGNCFQRLFFFFPVEMIYYGS